MTDLQGWEKLREISDLASGGEWAWNSYSVIHGGIAVSIDDEDPEYPEVAYLPVRTGDLATIQGEHDARLIVAAVNYLRAVLADRSS